MSKVPPWAEALTEASSASAAASNRLATTLERNAAAEEARRRPPRIGHHSDLRRLNVATFAALPGFWDQFTGPIPAEFWQQDVDDEGDVAVIACPCKPEDDPVVHLGSLKECACERVYAFTGRNVYVANSPKSRPDTEVRS